MSVSDTTLHPLLGSPGEHRNRVWSYQAREVTPGLWLATAELRRVAGQIGPAMKLIGRGATKAAAIIALAAEVDAYELMLSDEGGAA